MRWRWLRYNVSLRFRTLSAGVESIQNHIFFNKQGLPEQFGSNLQVITARLRQDFRFKAFGWDNELVYQTSSNKQVLALPQLSLYSNMYVTVRLAKVLMVQMGADMIEIGRASCRERV